MFSKECHICALWDVRWWRRMVIRWNSISCSFSEMDWDGKMYSRPVWLTFVLHPATFSFKRVSATVGVYNPLLWYVSVSVFRSFPHAVQNFSFWMSLVAAQLHVNQWLAGDFIKFTLTQITDRLYESTLSQGHEQFLIKVLCFIVFC